jgi:tetratricopeptide (TPR) repeat protein
LDPDFALAWAGLADAYVTADPFGGDCSEKGREFAEHALELDPNLGQAHAALGSYYVCKFEWAAAEQEYRRALELDPRYSTGHYWYALLLARQGRWDEALEHARTAAELDPLSLHNVTGYAWILLYAGRYEEARAVAARVLELNPNHAWSLGVYAVTYTVQGRWREATEANVRIAEILGSNPEAMRHAHAAMERHAKEGRPVPVPTDLGETYGAPFIQAAMLAMMGQPDSAMALLERLREEEGDAALQNAGVEPMLAPLHDDPRFVALLDKIGLAPVESARAWMKDR